MSTVETNPIGSLDPKSYTLLIVDDEPANLAALTSYLAGYGFHIEITQTGEKGLELARLAQPNLILLDVQLRGIDGFEACRRLKADERTREIPVIFMTVVVRTEIKIRGFEAGGVDYITKPFQYEEVLARVTTHLTLSRLQQELKAVNASLEQQVAVTTAGNAQLEKELAERKRAEEALAQSQSRLRSTLESMDDLVFVFDREARFTDYYAPRAELFMPPEIFMGKGPTQLIALAPEFEELAEPWKGAFKKNKEGQTSELEYQMEIGGEINWYATKVSPMFLEDAFAGSVAVVRNITARKRAEEQICRLNQELEQRVQDRTAELKAANKELADFSYSVSHDLRAPLRHMDGFLELVQQRLDDSLDSQARRYLNKIGSAAKGMGKLIDSLISFYQLRRLKLSKEQVELNVLVREAIRELEPDTAGRNIDWHIHDLPEVDGDVAMLRIVLANLITNAVKFTRPRQKAQIEIGSKPDPDTETVIYVRDNGVGFDMTYADKLFGVFQRLHHSDEFEGTGIGLANVRRVIARHGGRAWAEGKPDKGATFYFALPQTCQGGRHKNAGYGWF